MLSTLSKGHDHDAGFAEPSFRRLTHDSELHGLLERGARHRGIDRPAGDLHAVVGSLRAVPDHAGRHRREVLLTDLVGEGIVACNIGLSRWVPVRCWDHRYPITIGTILE